MEAGCPVSPLRLLYTSLTMHVPKNVLLGVILSNFAFICTLFISTRILLTSLAEITSFKNVLLAIVVSSYFKIFLMAMMIWEFPSSVPCVIDILVLSSNAVALRVVTRSTTARCIFICFSAHAAKFLANRVLR
ncbi:Arv1 family protein [Thalictrum thalictroides]|uniref:Protein ARV n=1 Tax=Thalictrum thalictroides TaxID=46969 RepID=A0A7J6UVP3_THATH|nr:Arv1 family protein [Thalictrum thalictroides]